MSVFEYYEDRCSIYDTQTDDLDLRILEKQTNLTNLTFSGFKFFP